MIRSADVRVPYFAPALLNEMTDLLDLPEQQRAAVHARLEGLARNYLIWKSVLAGAPVPSQSKKQIADIVGKLDSVLSNLDRLPPDLVMGLDLALEWQPN